MGISKELNRGRHCVSALHVHLVFIAKYRSPVFDRDALDRLRLLFTKICTDFESQLTEMHGEDHHVHLLVRYPPKVAVSNLVNSLKGVSSRMLRQERPDLAPRYWKGVLWSPSYFAASCGDAPLNMLKRDRKSTRLNSSHLVISYAVFCLKKKKKELTCISTA